jgi:FkbM family methyltransferase
MKNIINENYINQEELKLTNLFITSKSKKYILGINKFTKSILKYIEVDGIIDDFTRVQSSRKKDILQIENVPKDSIILYTSFGSPLEVKNRLKNMGFTSFSYLAFYKYSNLNLATPPFIIDFKDDFKRNKSQYEDFYNILEDDKSKEIFTKIINFKISFDYNFMQGFTNNFKEQYFDKDLIPNIKNITFLDGGGYVGDTVPNIIKNFPDFKKIYLIEPNQLHINIAKRDLKDIANIQFINCGLSNKKVIAKDDNIQNNCNHNYQGENLNTIDNILDGSKIDFIKLDIEGAEQDAIEGAKNTIKNHTPILAICIYHRAEDWYNIPLKVLKIYPNYKLYLRHYMEGIYETVLYFIKS